MCLLLLVFQLLPSATVSPAGQPRPVWTHDDEQLHGWTWTCQWGRCRTDPGPNARTDPGPNAGTDPGPNGHEPYGDG